MGEIINMFNDKLPILKSYYIFLFGVLFIVLLLRSRAGLILGSFFTLILGICCLHYS